MRIIAGTFKGTRLVSPGGSNTRPTSDRVKESLFSMLDGYGVLKAANVLDLFAGSGGLGFEAMSRGAAEVDFVDSAGASARVVETNAQKLGIDHSTRIHTSDVVTFLSSQRVPRQSISEQHTSAHLGGLDDVLDGVVMETRSDLDDEQQGRIFDLVFMDPPYPLGEDAVNQVLGKLSGLLDMESIVVVERASRAPEPTMPAALEVFRSKTFGETALYFLQLKAESDESVAAPQVLDAAEVSETA